MCDNRGESFELDFDPCKNDELLKIIKFLKSNSAGVDGLSLRASTIITLHFYITFALYLLHHICFLL